MRDRFSTTVALGSWAMLLILGGGASSSLRAQQPEPQYDPSLFQGLKWRNIGPFRGGRSVASAGVRGERHSFYFGGVGSGVWKTTDGGETWANVSDDTFGTSSVGAIAVAESDPNVVYVGMGEHAVRGVATSHGDGVYRSTDAGRSWQRLGLERTRQISAIRIHPRDPDLVYVAAQGSPYGPSEERGIYRSHDGGVSWEQILHVDRDSGASGLSLDPNNPRILYAAFWDHRRLPWQVRSGGAGSGLWKSVDSGDTWSQLGTESKGGFPGLIGKTSVSVAANSERVYALIEADPGGGLYRSDDFGKSWRLVNETWGIRARAWYYIKVYADPVDPDVVWITNARLYKSVDGGQTFTTVRVPHGDNHHLWINPDDTEVMINSNDGGANVSFNGGRSWSTQRNQPTAQFYRVTTDNQYPYHVYGGQQDNSAIGIKSRSPGGIGWDDFYSLGGCESAHVAFDPDDPELVYAGCYMGLIEEWQRSTGRTRDVMAYPMMAASMAARDMKYRFNWNAPIVASPHDPAIVYHGGNLLLRTSDRGVTWTEISPDLTRDEDEKQDRGGGPITNEGAGGEIYGTIFAVAPSPHEAGVIWTGSDDGLVHVTHDAGATWSEVTPRGLEEAVINSIEVSPHDPATAYLAITRYKFNDFTPLAFKTENYGGSWTAITTGLPEEAWVRVVREDPVRPGLLYLGSEIGPFVSFDGGGRWQSLSLNLPVSPITDLTVQRASNDLVAATQGRGFWILDNLSPLQQVDDVVAKAELHLFEPEVAVRGEGGGARPGGPPAGARVGKNPAGATFLDFVVAEIDSGRPVRLEILDAEGETVRTFEGTEDGKAPSEEAAPSDDNAPSEDTATSDDTVTSESTVPSEGTEKQDTDAKKSPYQLADEALITRFEVKAGMNRVPWDTRHRQVRPVPGLYVFGSLRGRKVVPGEYTVRLSQGGEGRTAALTVRSDPRLATSGDDYRRQDRLLAELDAELEEIHDTVLRLRDAHTQIESFIERLGDGDAELAEGGRELIEQLAEQENRLIQNRTVDGQTVINFPIQLTFHYIYLRGAIDQAEGVVNAGAEQRRADLSADWATIRGQTEALLSAGLDDFNQRVIAAKVPAVTVH